MEKTFYTENRRKLYDMPEPQSLRVLFAGLPIRKSADAFYPFYADRNFVYFIMSVPTYAKRISSAKRISYPQGISPVPWERISLQKALAGKGGPIKQYNNVFGKAA